jgi:histone deacetylase 1/2
MEMKSGDDYQSLANMAAKGGRGNNINFHGGGRGGNGHGGFGRGTKGGHGGARRQGGFQASVFCQLCRKEGHTIIKCFKRFDASFTGPPQKSASSATTSYGVDTNWYMDSGAIDHITSELDKLTVRDKYSGGEHVHAANIFGMEIKHVGHSTLHSPTSNIHLNHILHVPQAHKSLLSVNHIARDNDVFLEFHPNHFCVKEQQTRTLLRGPCEGGLYPLKSSSNKPSRISKPSA